MLNKLRIFFNEYLDELQNKVTWPKFTELQSHTVVVMVASFIIAFVIFAMDLGFSELLSALYGLFLG